MPITLSDLILDQRTIAVPIGKDPENKGDIEIVVTYRPSGLTPIIEAEANRMYAQGLQGCGTARLLSGMVVKWDITNDDGDPIPVTYEGMTLVPVFALAKILDELLADVRQSKEDLKNSGGGSHRAAKSVHARSFTR